MDQAEQFWHDVSGLATKFRQDDPEGLVAVVEIHTFDGQTYRPSVLQRRPPWILFEVVVPDVGDAAHKLVFVRETDVRRVDIFREPASKRSVGFSVGEVAAD
jgi:hypothetical protein